MKITDKSHPQVKATAAVLDRLDALPSERRGAFGASCAERLYPMYQAFSKEDLRGHPMRVRAAIDGLWQAVLNHHGAYDFSEDALTELVPEMSEHTSRLTFAAQYAVSCTIHAWRALTTRTSDEAAWCSIVSRDCIGEYLQWLTCPIYGIPTRDVEVELEALDWFSHPLMQHEMRKQFRDLELLANVGRLDEKAVSSLCTSGARGIAPFQRGLA